MTALAETARHIESYAKRGIPFVSLTTAEAVALLRMAQARVPAEVPACVEWLSAKTYLPYAGLRGTGRTVSVDKAELRELLEFVRACAGMAPAEKGELK